MSKSSEWVSEIWAVTPLGLQKLTATEEKAFSWCYRFLPKDDWVGVKLVIDITWLACSFPMYLSDCRSLTCQLANKILTLETVSPIHEFEVSNIKSHEYRLSQDAIIKWHHNFYILCPFLLTICRSPQLLPHLSCKIWVSGPEVSSQERRQ